MDFVFELVDMMGAGLVLMVVSGVLAGMMIVLLFVSLP
jgi:hypothetical protein